jgi:hypothetical protein
LPCLHRQATFRQAILPYPKSGVCNPLPFSIKLIAKSYI